MEVRLFKEFVKKIITIKRSQGQQAAEDWLAEKGRQEILAKLHPDNPDQHSELATRSSTKRRGG